MRELSIRFCALERDLTVRGEEYCAASLIINFDGASSRPDGWSCFAPFNHDTRRS
jgi:hypothetical protein